MKAKPFMLMSLLSALIFLGGCSFHPRKLYSGPDQPETNLALIRQTDSLESRPIYLLNLNKEGEPEIRVDNLGVIVLPGVYTFKGYLYHYRYQESARLVDATVYPGQSSFPIQEPVLRKVRSDKPYAETDAVTLTVKSGIRYGIWCSDDAKIHMKVLGSYP